MAHDHLDNLPTIESGGLDDRTIASPALGYGQERTDALPPDVQEQPDPTPQAAPQAQDPWAGPAPVAPIPDRLRRNEVAAVSSEMPYYVSDVPSPYLSSRQAQENVEDTRRRQGTVRVVLVSVLVLALVAGGVWLVFNALPAHEILNVPQYKTIAIERGEFLDTVDAAVLVEPIDSRAVAAGASGNLLETYVSEGAQVAEGDALFLLENKTVTESLNRAQDLYDEATERLAEKQAKLDEANEAVTSSEAALQAATTDTERTVAQAALDTAKTLQQSTQTEFDAADATFQTVSDTYNHAREQQDALTVRAPIAGTVTDLSDTVKAGSAITSSVHLCTISDLSRYALRVQIPAERRGMATEGQEVRMSFPEIEDLEVTSTIASIEDSEAMSVATVIIENPDERIQAGMQAQVSLVLQSLPDSLIVPLDTITYAEDGSAHLNVLLDPSRGINTDIPVTVVAQSPTEAAVKAENIQEGNAVIIP